MRAAGLTDKAAVELMEKICDGLKRFIQNNPENAPAYTDYLISEFLNPMAAEDGFGTEGWEHAFGIED